jgi:hypothetical protein
MPVRTATRLTAEGSASAAEMLAVRVICAGGETGGSGTGRICAAVLTRPFADAG